MTKPIPFGKYYLLERINVGGMAEVYRAKAYGVEGFERLVAVKRILPNVAEDKEFIKMFVDEAKLAVQLTHANIAQIFDLGMVGSDYYIAMEHVHGRDLRAAFERCREQGEAMPIAQACFCVMKVCEGLDYAHNKRDAGGNDLNLVHRDVSPQNVLCSFEGEVKLIDFGIAKAAGRGSQTEAGILKGKFGYMSPEQVRGLPIDRRSDVFSCGIVLYEMLTGERLFLGESDFSTLEKVRNVEILPPSTYNRRIPDELERIVLKALAKDVEDRYQNAIDLHDELQAFVYTAGEFYSRKDLAAWMKGTFARELDAEKAKLEQYQQFSPNQQQALTPSVPPTPRSPRSSSPPPPVPGARAGRVSVPPPIPGSKKPPAPAQMSAAPTKALDWDEDELETSIYDGPNTSKDVSRPLAATAGAIDTSPIPSRDQDLAGLVQKARDWNGSPEEPVPPVKTATGSGPRITVPPSTLPPESLPPESLDGLPVQSPRAARGSSSPPPTGEAASPAVAALAAMAQRQRSTYDGPTIDLMDRPMREGKTGLIMAIAAGALLLVGGIVAVVLLLSGEDKVASVENAPAVSNAALLETGFDLVVGPPGLDAEVRLDGKLMGKAPLTIRRVMPGVHKVEVIAPDGFYNQVKEVEVEPGKAPRIEIQLDGVPQEIAFTSEPLGAKAVLIAQDGARKEIGVTPATTKIDIHKSYKLELSRDGYDTYLGPLELEAGSTKVSQALTKSEDERRESESRRSESSSESRRKRRESRDSERVRSERARSAAKAPSKESAKKAVARAPEKKAVAKSAPEPAVVVPEVEPVKAKPAGKGTLLLGSKPPCQIYIDGRNTGLKTPQRQINLAEGKHKVVLVNNEHGIRDSFIVKIQDGKRTKVIRNLTEKMK